MAGSLPNSPPLDLPVFDDRFFGQLLAQPDAFDGRVDGGDRAPPDRILAGAHRDAGRVARAADVDHLIGVVDGGRGSLDRQVPAPARQREHQATGRRSEPGAEAEERPSVARVAQLEHARHDVDDTRQTRTDA